MELKIGIPVNKETKYFQILKALSFIPPFSELSNRELQVFSELLTVYNKYPDMDEEDKNLMVFSKATKQSIAEKYTLSKASVHNIMMSLRQKGLIDSTSILPPYNLKNIDNIVFRIKCV